MLRVDNVPDDLYEAVKERARKNRTSISAEVIKLLEENVPTVDEIARRRALVAEATKLRSRRSPAAGPYPSSEEMVREDRGRW